MRFALTDEQEMLRESVRGVVARECKIAELREWTERGDAAAKAREIVRRHAWPGIGFGEATGGQGGGLVELALVVEELGRVVFPGAFLATALSGSVAAGFLDADRWSSVVSGDEIATLAITGSAPPDSIIRPVIAVAGAGDDNWRLSGELRYVLAAGEADLLLVPAEVEGALKLFAVDPQAAGVTLTPLVTTDATRTFADLRLDAVPAKPLAGGEPVAPALTELAPRACALIAADSLGGAQRSLELTAEYAAQRQQFGKPIGSFQAVKHGLAEMLVEVEAMRSGAYFAAWAVETDQPGAARDASVAKAFCCDAYRRITDRAIALHGAIGFTWEHDMHLYFKRARANAHLYGSSDVHRERVAAALDLLPR